MNEKPQHLTDGKLAESLAEKYLIKQGLRLREKNYRCRYGEIDLICDDKDSIVFIEVRYRKNACFGSAKESVNLHKQRKTIITAKHYLISYPDKNCRFDVIALSELNIKKIEWIKNAFDISSLD